MVESLEKLNQLCQKPRYKEVGNWMVRTFLRDAALRITWLLLLTGVTANQVTLASLVVALLGVFLFTCHPEFCFFLGSALLQMWYLLDHVDGQIARYRETACLSGRFFDFLTHHIIHATIFFALGLYGFNATGHFVLVIWGFVAALSMAVFNLVNDTKYKTFFEALAAGKAFRMVAEEGNKDRAREGENPSRELRKIFSFFHKLCEIHVLMNILTAVSVLELLVGNRWDGRLILLFFYGSIVPALAVIKPFYLIKNRRIDDEFRARFVERES